METWGWERWTHPAEILSCSPRFALLSTWGHGSAHHRLTAAGGAAVADVRELDSSGDLVPIFTWNLSLSSFLQGAASDSHSWLLS